MLFDQVVNLATIKLHVAFVVGNVLATLVNFLIIQTIQGGAENNNATLTITNIKETMD